jgi:CheY-like chemotaxis protein
MVAAKLLDAVGCDATILEDGGAIGDAIARAAEARRPIDLVFIDRQLGGLDGFAVCRAQRASGVAIPMVCVSADVMDIEQALAAGFDGVLDKPFSAEDLRACVQRYVR